MSKEIIYELEYREQGEKKKEVFIIDFICNEVFIGYGEILTEAESISMKWNKIKSLKYEQIEKGNRQDIEKEIRDLESEIKNFNSKVFFSKRFDLLKIILEDNGCKDDKFLDFKFWNRCVEPDVMIEFMTKAIYRNDNKKKAE